MQIIVIHGAPGTGKTTISKKLHEHYKSPWFEFGWIPEFRNKNPYTEISCKDEEQMTFESLVLVTKNYVKHGFENIILSDLNDIRLLDIPSVFEDLDYIIFTFYGENESVIKECILSRDNGNDYKDYEQAFIINRKILSRKTLPNEYRVCSGDKTPEAVISQILSVIENHKPMVEFDRNKYSRDDYFSYTN